MSVESAEAKVTRAKAQLTIAYHELRVARAKAIHQKRETDKTRIQAVHGYMQKFCDEYLANAPGSEYGLEKLPLKLRFIMCSMAQGVDRKTIAEFLPKGKTAKIGITVGGLSSLIRQARMQLKLLNREKL